MPQGLELLEFVNSLKPVVVMITMTNEAGGEVASATGLMLENAVVLAPRDVVARGPSGRITLFNDQALVIKAVAAEDDATGLALVTFEMPVHLDQNVIEKATLAIDVGIAGDELIAVSSPLGRQNYAVTPGKAVIANRGDADRDMVAEFSLPARSNGSPIFDAEGRVVGVAVERPDKAYSIVPAGQIIELAVEAAETAHVPLQEFHEKHTPATAANGEEPVGTLKASIEKRADGSMLVDGEFIVRGNGTESDPYRMTWDHLISAARDYEPRAGRTQLPERITMLDGKWVELTGYLAFPLGAEESDELLLMLNQWDGCCIGVPPTPYDAVEVTLVAPYKGEAGINIFNYGTVHGRLEVDPYVTNGWLIGLYLMEEATLSFDD
jgi:hypothetical protein